MPIWGIFREVCSERLQTVCGTALTVARRAGAAGPLKTCGNVLTNIAGGLRHSFIRRGFRVFCACADWLGTGDGRFGADSGLLLAVFASRSAAVGAEWRGIAACLNPVCRCGTDISESDGKDVWKLAFPHMIGRRFLRAFRVGFPQVFQNLDLHSGKAKAAAISVFYLAQYACSARAPAGVSGGVLGGGETIPEVLETRIPPHCP